MKEETTKKFDYLKVLFIALLCIILLVPLLLVSSLVTERSQRKSEVGQEISSKWGGSQTISAPVFIIPYQKQVQSKIIERGVEKTVTTFSNEFIHLLPNNLDVDQSVETEARKRGIYKAVVYNSFSTIKESFGQLNLEKEGIKTENVAWENARLVLGITDLKGLSAYPEMSWNGKKLDLETNAMGVGLFEENLSARVDLSEEKTTRGNLNLKLDLRGSEVIDFNILAKETNIHVKGNWGTPSFDGDYLPNERKVEKDSFVASWKVQGFDRKLPQQWVGSLVNNDVAGEKEVPNIMYSGNRVSIAFLDGMKLYSQTERTLKYGILIIVLSFVTLFLTEMLSNKPFHIIHYGLIGAALVIFYTLLLSISEHVGFNSAYLIAFLATCGIISWFVKNITNNLKIALVFAGILSLFFGFNFVLMQLEDYALLVGSIGLFVILGALMHFTSKINWLVKSEKP